jgi:hypothetical protein
LEEEIREIPFLTFNMNHPSNPAFPAVLALESDFLGTSRKRMVIKPRIPRAGFAGSWRHPSDLSG